MDGVAVSLAANKQAAFVDGILFGKNKAACILAVMSDSSLPQS